VDPDSASAKAGLQPGDVIQEINRKPVTSAEEAISLTESRKQDRTVVRVWRDGNSRYVAVDESRKK
jgi:serine protease Do